MKLADIRPDLADEVGGRFEIGRLGGIGIEPEIVQRGGKNVIGGIQHVNPAILELGELFRLEDDVPAVDFRIGAEDVPHRLDIVADTGGAPHVIGGVLIAGVINRQPLRQRRPGIDQIRQL